MGTAHNKGGYAPNRMQFTEGQEIGNCTLIEEVSNRGWRRFAKFRCECGNEFVANIYDVKSGHTTSCGCGSHRFSLKRKADIHIYKSEYGAWCSIKGRCYNPKNEAYKNYGGRGIKVCQRWLDSFDAFLEDMGPKPSKYHSIERIEVNGDYEPNNCCWATIAEQAKNKRNTRWLTGNGETLHLSEWSRRLGVSNGAILKRINSGMPMDQVLSKERYIKGKLQPHKVRLILIPK